MAVLQAGAVTLPALVIAEVFAGAETKVGHEAVAALMNDLPLHTTDRAHWIRVGELRRFLRSKGISVSTLDSHVAQCAIDLNATLLARDAIFSRIARHTPLRLSAG